jgi:oligopeptide/dipeptide ABC transporter ATP-binding protein
MIFQNPHFLPDKPTIQAQILDLLSRSQRELGMAILMITHDLGVVAEMCDEVIVMYAGRVVERAQVRDLFGRPRHPYTQGLLAASPGRVVRGTRLPTIPGMVPAPNRRGAGCRFADRCGRALERCGRESPPLSELESGHAAACWNPVP